MSAYVLLGFTPPPHEGLTSPYPPPPYLRPLHPNTLPLKPFYTRPPLPLIPLCLSHYRVVAANSNCRKLRRTPNPLLTGLPHSVYVLLQSFARGHRSPTRAARNNPSRHTSPAWLRQLRFIGPLPLHHLTRGSRLGLMLIDVHHLCITIRRNRSMQKKP
ncbi:hypothetical protein VPH35_015441 [Triticum aestivum]